MVLKGKKERESIFRLADPDRVKSLLITYRAGIADEMLDSVVDVLVRI